MKKHIMKHHSIIRKVMLLAIVILVIVSNAWSQKETVTGTAMKQEPKLHWGIKGGVNIATLRFSADNHSEDAESVVGAVVGVTMAYSFTPKWHLHSGLELSMKGFKMDMGNEDLTVRANYLQIPLEIGYLINIGKSWHFEPRLGFFAAYGINGKMSISGEDEKANTFGDELFKNIDTGVGVGFYFDNSQFIIGVHGEVGFGNVNGDNFKLNGVDARTTNIAFTAGYLF